MSHNLQAKSVKSVVGEPRIRIDGRSVDTEPCTTSSGHSERCHNPLCANQVEPLENGWRRTERRFCKDECRQHASLIRRVSKLLENETDERALEILRGKP
jgi:hypothetical protein